MITWGTACENAAGQTLRTQGVALADIQAARWRPVVSVIVGPPPLFQLLQEAEPGAVLAADVGAVRGDLPATVALANLGFAQALSGCAGDHQWCVHEGEDVGAGDVLVNPAQRLFDAPRPASLEDGPVTCQQDEARRPVSLASQFGF